MSGPAFVLNAIALALNVALVTAALVRPDPALWAVVIHSVVAGVVLGTLLMGIGMRTGR